ELALPFLEAPEIRERWIEPTEVDIRERQQVDVRGGGYPQTLRERIADDGDAPHRRRRAVEREVGEEAVVARGLASARSRVPDVSSALFPVGPVELDFVPRARQKVGIRRIDGVVRLALGGGGEGDVDVSVGPFAVVRETAAGVVDRRGLVVDVR